MRQVSVLLDEDVSEAIEKFAVENDRTFSESIRHALRLVYGPARIPKSGRTGRKPFTPPSLDEIREHIISSEYHTIDAEAFHAFYESKGWRVGNQPMRDWRAACVTWEKRSSATNKGPIQKSQTSDARTPLSPKEANAVRRTVVLAEAELPEGQRRFTAGWTKEDWDSFNGEVDKP